MTLATQVTATEAEVIRVYDVALPELEAIAISVKDVAHALGVETLDDEYVDIFAVETLDDLGLTGYMTDGLGIPTASLADYSERLAKADGTVVVVLSKAFQGQAATLKNGHPLRLIGAFAERKAQSIEVDLTTPSAEVTAKPAKKQKSEAAQSGMVATVALLAMFAFVAFIIWIA